MAGNTFGQLFTVTTAGESHGPALIAIIDGCPPGLPLEEGDIQYELDRRRPGRSQYTSQRRESDQVNILSGVFEGTTTGAPIALMIENHAHREKDYQSFKNYYRPGHADFTYEKKYGVRDYRGGGRSSARETVLWVAAGAIAKKYLSIRAETKIQGYLAQLGPIVCETIDWTAIEKNDFFCPDVAQLSAMQDLITQLQCDGDSIGAAVCVKASNVSVGLGEPVFSKLHADLAQAMMSINAVKSVEIGDGNNVVTQKGSEHRDEISPDGFLSNHAGGVLGGISTGQDINVRIGIKPTSGIRKIGQTVNTDNEACEISVTGRHDPCAGIRAVPIAEAMTALVLMDHFLRHRAQCS